MYLDKQNLFSEAQAVTATAQGTNVVDFGKGDIGPSQEASLFVGVDGYAGTGTLIVELLTSDVCTSGALTSPVTAATFPVSNAVLLAGGRVVSVRLPYGMKRYAGLNYVVTGTLTGGKITAGIVLDV